MNQDRRGLLAAPMIALAGTAAAQAATRLTLGTATPGGGFPVFGAAFAGAVGAADPGLAIETRNTAGSLENVGLLAEGRLDLALVAGETATAALGRGTGVTLAAAMYSSPGLFALRGDAAEGSVGALRGKRIAWGARSSGLVVLARQVMGGLGLDLERDFDAVFLDRAGDGPPMVLEGRAAALWGAGVGWPGFVTLSESAPGVRFVAPDAGERARVLASDPTLRAMALPAGSYARQAEAVPTVGNWSLVLARPGLPEEAGFRPRGGEGPPMVLGGRAAALGGAGVGWPGFVTLSESAPGVRFVAPDAGERARVLASDPELRAMALPAGSYARQAEAVPTVGNWSLVLARPGLPEEAGFRLAAALHAARADIARRLPQAAETTAENTVAAAPGPGSLHPGVARFLRGAGFLA